MNALCPVSPEKALRYAVYSLRLTTKEGLVSTRSFIVLKNGYNVIVRFTRFHEYAVSSCYLKFGRQPLLHLPDAELYAGGARR